MSQEDNNKSYDGVTLENTNLVESLYIELKNSVPERTEEMPELIIPVSSCMMEVLEEYDIPHKEKKNIVIHAIEKLLNDTIMSDLDRSRANAEFSKLPKILDGFSIVNKLMEYFLD